MQAIILILNAVFAKLTTAVNKAFQKSQRNSFDFTANNVLFNGATFATFAAYFITESFDPETSSVIRTPITFLDGDGKYRVRIVSPYSSIINGESVGNGTQVNLVVVNGVIVSGIIEHISDSDKGDVLTTAGNTAQSKVNVGKTEAIQAAGIDATTKANSAIATAASDATTKANSAIATAASDATSKANAAKTDAISAAAADATQKVGDLESNLLADMAQNIAIAKAESLVDATLVAATKANAAISTAASDATTKANAAKTEAVTDAEVIANDYAAEAERRSKMYTDVEIAKLQQYASIGVKSYKTFEGLVTQAGANSTIADLPSYVAFGIPTTELGTHIINVAGVNADGSIVDDKEFTLTVPTGVNAQGLAITTNIVVSTNDKLIVELYKLADGSYFMKYVQKYDDRLMEVVKQLVVRIDDQVSETELESAIADVKTYVDAQINAALV